jgi:hypothetical protein
MTSSGARPERVSRQSRSRAPVSSIVAFSALALIAATAGRAHAQKIDFNGDGNADLTFRHIYYGGLVTWELNGSRTSPNLVNTPGTSFSTPSVPSSEEWYIAGEGDFNGDGHPDLFWQNGAGGAASIWFMNGLTMTSSPLVSSPNGVGVNVLDTTQWRVGGVGLFNNDRTADLLWWNRESGELFIWYMNEQFAINGVFVTQGQGHLTQKESTGWSIAGVRDWNNDGTSDIVWHNAQTGAVQIWFMDTATGGTTRDSVVTLNTNGYADSSNFRLVAVDDFDNNGTPDLVWHDIIRGTTEIWFYNGTLGRISVADLPASQNLTDYTDWRFESGSPPYRTWRGGHDCQPVQNTLVSGYTITGVGLEMPVNGTAACALLKETSGINNIGNIISDDAIEAVDVDVTVPSGTTVTCAVTVYESGSTTSTNIVQVNQRPAVYVSPPTSMSGIMHIPASSPLATSYWQQGNFLYADLACSSTGSGRVTINQYWVREDGVTQTGRIYPASACQIDAANTAAWLRQPNMEITSQYVAELEALELKEGDPGTAVWDCGETDGELNDPNSEMDMMAIPNLNFNTSVTGICAGGFNIPSAGGGGLTEFFTSGPNNFSGCNAVTITSPGNGDFTLQAFRTY